MQRTPTCRNCCRNYSFQVSPKQRGVNIPLLLDCAHTFCEGCLKKFASIHKTHIPCPICKIPTTLNKDGVFGVKDLNVDVYIMGILATNYYKWYTVESFSPKKSPYKVKLSSNKGIPSVTGFLKGHVKTGASNKATDLKCEECFSASATSRCIKCECVFCVKCFEKVHSMSHTLRKHKPLSILSSSEKSSGCDIHNNRPLEFFDKDDNQPVCAHCIVMGDREIHSIVPIDEVANEIKEQIQEKLNAGRMVLKHLERSLQKIREVLTQNQSEKTVLTSEIREHFQLLSAKLQVRENILVRNVECGQFPEETLEMSIAESVRKTRSLLLELENALREPTTLVSRSKEFIDEIQELQESACFAVKTSHKSESSRFCYDNKYMNLLNDYGSIHDVEMSRLDMKKLADVDQDDMNDEQVQELLDEQKSEEDEREEIANTGCQTRAARRMLSIPYRHELVQVTHIKDPSYFVVQRLADMDQLNVMMNAINKYCDSSDTSDLVFEVNVGDVVCAQFSVDNNWYRARVVSVYSLSHPNTLPTIDNNLTIQVLYMDFGNSEWVPMIRLRRIPSKFLHIPDMTLCCCLEDIIPPFQQIEWPVKTIKAFGSLTGNKVLLMTAYRRGAGGILHVDLKSPDDEEPTHDDDRPASVRDALVFLEVARFKSPASQINTHGQQTFPMRVFKNPPPIEEGQNVTILVTHATGPDDIYLQLIEDNSVQSLLKVMNCMDKLYTGKQKRKDMLVSWPYRGLVCGAQFSEDKAWYRALVLGVNSDETVDVNYVDYGNSERLPFSALRKLPDSLLSLPRQARRASMADITDPNGNWGDKVCQFVCELLIGRSFKASVISVNDEGMSVVLCDNTTIKDVSVNEVLVQLCLAIPAGLGIVKQCPEEEEGSESNLKDSASEGKQTEDKEKLSNEADKKQDTEYEFSDRPHQTPLDKLLGLDPLQQKLEPTQGQADEPSLPGDSSDQSPSERSVESSPQRPSPPDLRQEPSTCIVQGSYKPALVPVNKQFQAGVTYIGMDGYIYVQEVKPDDNKLMETMSKLIKLHKEPNKMPIPTSTDDITAGKPCCAYFSGDGLLYRAEVTKVISTNKVEVNYIDFGNSEVLSLSAIRLATLDMDIPKQCLQLILYGIVPASSDGQWSVKAISVLSNLIVGKNCSVMIEGDVNVGQPIEVRLCSPEGTNVSDELLSQGLARPADGMQRLDPRNNFLPAGVNRGLLGNGRKGSRKHPSRTETKLQAALIGAREAEQILPNTRLPEDHMTFDVIVTHVDQADCLFIQRSPNCVNDDVYDIDPTLLNVEDELERLENMQININKPDYFKKYEPLLHASKGMLCCCKYTEDDTWYRGQVLDVISEKPLTALVRYIDYGNSEELTGDRMRGFPSELLDLPIQSIQCRLAHVRPPKSADSTTEGPSWPERSSEELIELVVGRRLEARIVGCGSPISIELNSANGDEKANIGKKLAEQGHAIYRHKNHDNDVSDSLDTVSEGAPSHCSYDVEIEDEQILDNEQTNTERVLEFKETEREVSDKKFKAYDRLDTENLPVEDRPTHLDPAAIPLLTPNEFAMCKTADHFDCKGATIESRASVCQDNKDSEKAIKVNDDANESEV